MVKLFQFDRPVGVVEELLPALVAAVRKVQMDGRVSSWFDGLSDKFHTGLPRGFAAFFAVALCAGTDEIFPACLSA